MSLVLFLLIILTLVASDTINWKADETAISTRSTRISSSIWNFAVTVTTNGPLYPDEGGHFMLSLLISYSNGARYSIETECINLVTDKPIDIQRKLYSSDVYVLSSNRKINTEGKFADIAIVKSKKFLNHFNSTSNSKTTLQFEYVKKITNITDIASTINSTKCSNVRTFGKWNDRTRWREGKVPVASDTVIIPANAGVILVSKNISVTSLTINGGELQLYESGCPPGWSLEDTSTYTA